MKTPKEMIQCGFDNQCIEENTINTLKLKEIRAAIVSFIILKQPIPDEFIEEFKKRYQTFAKSFFTKKTVECMRMNCKKKMLNNTAYLDKVLKQSETLKKNLGRKRDPLSSNFRKIMKLIIQFIKHFKKNYIKYYL